MNWINRAWKKSIRLANSKNMQRQFSGLILAFLLGVIIYKLVFGEIEQLSLVLGIGVSILILLKLAFFAINGVHINIKFSGR